MTTKPRTTDTVIIRGERVDVGAPIPQPDPRGPLSAPPPSDASAVIRRALEDFNVSRHRLGVLLGFPNPSDVYRVLAGTRPLGSKYLLRLMAMYQEALRDGWTPQYPRVQWPDVQRQGFKRRPVPPRVRRKSSLELVRDGNNVTN